MKAEYARFRDASRRAYSPWLLARAYYRTRAFTVLRWEVMRQGRSERSLDDACICLVACLFGDDRAADVG